MRTTTIAIIWILILGLLSCEKEDKIEFLLDPIDTNKYYSYEIIPTDYQKIYGKWKLYKVSDGLHGTGYEPDFDYLEIKSIGIYGLIRNDSLFEYGKIELDTFDIFTTDFLQVKFIPDYHLEHNSYIYPQEKYIDLIGIDSMDLISPCCDSYDYHYKRIK